MKHSKGELKMPGKTAIRLLGRLALLLPLTIAWWTSAASACDTPVYRYAMYRWLPAPYEVYCFHRGALDESSQAVKDAIEQASEAEENRANVVFLAVDLDKDPELKTVPPDVKKAREADPQDQLPRYLISSPVPSFNPDTEMPVHVYSGELTKDAMPALFSSPAREEMANQLAQGRAGVFVFLPGTNQEKNEKAEKVIQGVVDDVASGKVQLYVSPALAYAAENEDGENPVPKTEVGFVKVDRNDEAEQWFVRTLLSLDYDLKDSEEPMLFTVYGRGRALFSCLGDGIHEDNLLQDIEFITGACSCTVKEQNPGVDLLVHYDWEAAAASVAEKFGAEEGSRYHFSGDSLFPELIIPSNAGEMDSTDSADDEDVAVGASKDAEPVADTEDQVAQADSLVADDREAEGSVTVDQPSSKDSPPTAEPETAAATDREQDVADAPQQVASNMPAADPDPSADQGESGMRGVVFVGVGLVVALIVLFGATFVVLRPK
jgi:hypothetical protein